VLNGNAVLATGRVPASSGRPAGGPDARARAAQHVASRNLHPLLDPGRRAGADMWHAGCGEFLLLVLSTWLRQPNSAGAGRRRRLPIVSFEESPLGRSPPRAQVRGAQLHPHRACRPVRLRLMRAPLPLATWNGVRSSRTRTPPAGTRGSTWIRWPARSADEDRGRRGRRLRLVPPSWAQGRLKRP
jgi:hypothetical protein